MGKGCYCVYVSCARPPRRHTARTRNAPDPPYTVLLARSRTHPAPRAVHLVAPCELDAGAYPADELGQPVVRKTTLRLEAPHRPAHPLRMPPRPRPPTAGAYGRVRLGHPPRAPPPSRGADAVALHAQLKPRHAFPVHPRCHARGPEDRRRAEVVPPPAARRQPRLTRGPTWTGQARGR